MAAASILHKGHDGASELLPWLMYTTVWTIFAITLLSTMFQPASVNYNYRHISFLMGWYSCYWKALLPNETTFSSPVTDNPPFIIDVCKSSKIMINLEGAHPIFLGIVKDNTSLEELDFIGRLRDRFPER